MENAKVKLLVTGDLHLGRHPTKIPEEFDSREFSPIFLWEQIVQKAVNLEVDAILIAGDIIDKANRFFEAFGPLETGIKKLEKNNIFVYTVAGNHDYEVLKRLKENIDSDNFYLLGTEGKWETKILRKKNQDLIEIVGWSYFQRQIPKNPLSELKLEKKDLPAIGLLHSEMDNPSSNYAPVRREDLESFALSGWVLGHIHQPFLYNEFQPFILNPGSPLPLNPGEPGDHWIWGIYINSENNFEIKKYKLSPLQYLNLEIDISQLENLDKITSLISKKIREKLEQKEFLNEKKLILIRLVLAGTTEFFREIEQIQEKIKEELELNIRGVRILIERIINKTEMKVKLEKLTEQNDQMGLLADYIYKIRSRQQEKLPEELIEAIEKSLLEVYNANTYQPLRIEGEIEPPSREQIISYLEKEGINILKALLEQKEE